MDDPERPTQPDPDDTHSPLVKKEMSMQKPGHAGENGDDSSNNLSGQEQSAGSTWGVGRGYANETPQTGDGTTANMNNAKQRESNSGDWNNKFTGSGYNAKGRAKNAVSAFKKKGPMGLLLAIFGGGSLAIGAFISPSLLLVQMKAVFTNDLSDATSTVEIRSDALLQNKIAGLKSSFGVCGKVINLRCAFRTMSAEERANFEEKGFKIEGDLIGTGDDARTSVTAITTPEEDGAVRISDPKQLKNLDAKTAAAFRKVFSPATPFINRFFSTVLEKFGLSKGENVSGNSDEEVRANQRESLGVDTANASATTPKYKIFQKLSETAAKTSDAASKSLGIQLLCTAYNFASALTTGVRTARLAIYTGFAMGFLITADAIMSGTAQPAATNHFGNQANDSDQNKTTADGKPNDLYQKTATNSPGYEDANNNESHPLPEQFLIGAGKLILVIATIKKAINGVTGGTANTKLLCKTAQGAGVVQCFTGGFITAGICGAVLAFGPAVITPIITSIIEEIVKSAVNISLDDNTVGSLAGSAIFVGTAGILSNMGQFLGMKPASASDFKGYLAYTDSIRKRDVAIAHYEAQSQPLNVYNKYSFLGSIASSLNIAAFSGSSIGANITQLYSMIPAAFASAGTASAGIFMPTNPYNPDRFNQVHDEAYDGICTPDVTDLCREYTPDSVLSGDIDTNIDWMQSNGHVAPATSTDITGAPTSDDYTKYLKYCVHRSDPLGVTSDPVESADDWSTGVKCAEHSTEIDQFTQFTIDNNIRNMSDNPAGSTTTSTASSLQTNAGTTQTDTASINVISSLLGPLF